MKLIRNIAILLVVIFFTTTSYSEVYIKERLGVNKKQNKLVRKGSKGKNIKIKLISTKKKRIYKKKVSKKKSKKKKYKKRSLAKKKSKKNKKKSKKKIISSMKTCAVYNPPGKKSTIVIEATSAKRKIAKKKRCKTYRVTKKNGKSFLIIEVADDQI